MVPDPLLMWAEAVDRLEDDLEDAETDDDSEVLERKVFETSGRCLRCGPGPGHRQIAAGLLPLRTLIVNGVIGLVSAPRIRWRDAQPLMSNTGALDAVIASKPAFVRQVLSQHPGASRWPSAGLTTARCLRFRRGWPISSASAE